jgi:hypothetical protein
MVAVDLKAWLRDQCAEYVFDLRGVFRLSGFHPWPLTAVDRGDLEVKLTEGGHLLPLPKEPAALANVLEVSIVDFLMARVAREEDAEARRGGERFYPDLEVSGDLFGGGFHAVDVNIARRGATKKGPSDFTQSRITLYTGNTYFMYPSLHWPGTFRAFNDYQGRHLDVIGIYTLDTASRARVVDLELIVQEPWRIASRQRSSTTREYIGAVQRLQDLRQGAGEFPTPEAFYTFWRKFDFKIGKSVKRQLDKLLAGDEAPQGVAVEPPRDLPV